MRKNNSIMKTKMLFWLAGALITLIGLPAYLLGFLWQICKDEFRAGARKQRLFVYWLNKLYKQLYNS